ncbi:MAG: TIGR00282 family metallophosphoesterase [Saccharofermentanales bacterium]
MNILFIGDIVGSSGRSAIRNNIKRIRNENAIDLCIANAENSAAGLGITPTVARDLFDSGIDALTMGNHTWSKSDIFNFIDSETRIARPANVCENWPGKGYTVAQAGPHKAVIINLLGRVGMNPANCPFDKANEMIPDLKQRYNTKVVIIDFHAEATSEKQAFARHFDGRVSLVVGTHTHVQTADECILERGTGFITDVGMTGPVNSVIGMEISSSVRRFVDKLPVPYRVAEGPSIFSAVVAQIDESTGRATSIRRIREI